MKNKTDNLDDIIFENRNKEYGAYDLRKKYSKRGSVALGISLIVLLIAVGAPLIANIINKNKYDKNLEKNVSIDLVKFVENPEDVLPPPPLPEPPPTVKQVSYEAIKIVDSLSIEVVEILTADELGDLSNNLPVDTSENIIVIIEDTEPKFVDDKPLEIYEIQELPSFIGGDEALLRYIAENVIYPQEAQENDIQGTVYIRFVVKSTGDVDKAQVLRGVHELLDNEALRVVKSLPRWKPGKQNGNAVSVWFTIPIKFILQ